MNVVFDLGAVLLAWEPTRLVQTHLPEHAPTEAAAAALGRALFHHDDWMSFDCGMRSLDEAIARMARRLSLPAARLDAMLGTLGERLEPIAVTVELLEGLFARREAGEALRLYYLSNMPAPYARAVERRHGFMRRFDGGVFSGDVKFIKPDREIYELLAVRHALEPAETVFIDDSAANVEAARAFGWQAIHCTHPSALAAQLARHLPAVPAGPVAPAIGR
ncbi:HAD family phosphatase [Variovorax paradoxus]|uniref:HAD family hydrolase n=1 Tax=Variovorax paradoxus TaxID=34073 RepID=UPI003ECFD22F